MSTVAEIISQYNTERPNQVEDAQKVLWLRKCERMIINEILVSHEHDLEEETRVDLKVVGSHLVITGAGSFEQHIDSFDMDTPLLVPEPYDDLYLHYLDQRIALNNNDKTRYNTAAAQYNNALLTYQQYVNRTYKTKKISKKLLNHSDI
jgi:hypothetical protein